MSTPVTIKGSDSTVQEVVKREDLPAGMHVYTTEYERRNAKVIPFLNEAFGDAMNQDVTFGGTPELIFDGGSGGTEWAGTGPAQWNFSSGGNVVVNHAPNNSQALFTDSGSIDPSGYTALTGRIDLDNYTPATQKIVLQFRLSGVDLGNSIDLDDYIDTGNFAFQSFVVPLADFGSLGLTVDEFTITILRTAGHNPHIKFDDFQIEQTGQSLEFKVAPVRGEEFHIEDIIITIADNVTSSSDVSYDRMLGLAILGNGIVYKRFQDNQIQDNVILKDIGAFLSFGATGDYLDDGTNTFVTLTIHFDEHPLLNGNKEDYVSFTINDPMSALLKMSALSRGHITLPKNIKE